MFEDAFGLVFGQDERQALLMFGVDKLDEFTNRDAQDVPIEKDDGVEGLILGCWGDIPFHRQIGEDRGDGLGAEFCRMVGLVKLKETTGPSEIGLMAAAAATLRAVAPRDGWSGPGHRSRRN